MKPSLRRALPVAILVVLGFSAYALSLRNTALLHHIPSDVTDPGLDNPLLRSFGLLPKVFTGEFLLSTGGEYRPLGCFLFGVLNSLFRDSGGAFWHLVTIGLHLAAGALVFVALRALLGELSAGALAAAYILHPGLVPAVNDVNMIYILWGLLFVAGSLCLFVVHLKERCPWALAGSLVLFLCAAFTWRGAVVAPAFVAALCLLRERPRAAAATVAMLAVAAHLAGIFELSPVLTLGVLAVAAVFVALAMRVERERYSELARRLPAYLGALALFAVIAWSVDPVHLHGYYLERFLHGDIDLAEPFGPAFVSRALLASSLLSVAALVVASAMPAALALRAKTLGVVGGAAVVALFAGVIAGSLSYRDGVAYWKRIDAARPGMPAVELNLAEAHLDAGEHEAARDILLALLYEKDRPPLFQAAVTTRLGRAYEGMGQDKAAGFYYFDFGTPTNWHRDTMKNSLRRIAPFCLRTGYISCAEYFWASALVMDRYDPRLYVDLGRALVYKNFFRAAERHFRRALELEPGNETALYYLAFVAEALGRKGDHRMWAERWRSATGSEAGPDFQPIFDGFSFEKEKMLSWFSGEPRFFAMFTEWTAKGPYVYRMAGKDYSFAEVPFDVGAHFVRKGDYGEAYDYLLRAHEADPGLRPAARMLAEVCRKTGRLDEALRVEEKLGGAP